MNLLFHSVSGPGALPPLSVTGPGAVSVLSVGSPRSLCPAPAVSVLGPGCVGPRRSLCRGPALSVSALLCRALPLSRCPSRTPTLSFLGPALSLSRPGRARPPAALCRTPASLALCPQTDVWFAVGPCPRSGPHATWAARASRLLMRTPPTHQPPAPIRVPPLAPSRQSLCHCPALFLSGFGDLYVAARRSLCRAPALFVSGLCRPTLFIRAQHSPCRGPALSVAVGIGARRPSPKTFFCQVFVSGPGALCVGARRSLCRARRREWRFLRRGPALYLCRGPTLFLSGPGALCQGLCRGSVSGPDGFCFGAGRSSTLFVSRPGTLQRSLCVEVCVGARRSSPDTFVSGLALFILGPSGLCVEAQRSVRQGPAHFVSRPGAVCVGARRSLSRPVALCRGPALCIGPRARRSVRSASGPGAPLPTLSLSGPAACVSGPGACCQGPALFMSGPGGLCVEAQRSVALFGRGAALCVWGSAWPCATQNPSPSGPALPSACQLRSACHPFAPLLASAPIRHRAPISATMRPAPIRHLRAPHPAPTQAHPCSFAKTKGIVDSSSSFCKFGRGPSAPSQRATHPDPRAAGAAARAPMPAGPQLESACHPSNPARSLFLGENPKPYCLGDKS